MVEGLKWFTHLRLARKIDFQPKLLACLTSATCRSLSNRSLVPHLDMFRKGTISRRFVDLDMMFCSFLVHYFLLREVADDTADSMSLNIGAGTIVTFSKAEFLLITGLWRPSSRVIQKKVSKKRL